MSSSLRKLTLGFVRATNDWPILSSGYRAVYHAAARAAARLAEKRPAIVGIYARNSYAMGGWAPGLSDIDLTVVWRRPNNADLTDFFSRYDRLQKRFPMLGEAEMIEEAHLPAWDAHAVTGLESNRWLKLAGEDRIAGRYAGDERLDRLRHAVSIYRYNLIPLFYRAASDETRFLRFAAKLFRQFGKPTPAVAGRSAVLAACLRQLSTEITGFPFASTGPAVDYASAPAELRPFPKPAAQCVALLGHAGEAAPRYGLVSNIPSFDGAATELVFMDDQVFRFYLCFVDPLEYLILLRGRTLFYGSDPLAEPFVLTRQQLLDSVQHYAVQMLTYPYRREIGAMSQDSFRDLLYGWFLRTLRYLEDGFMDFEYHTLREYFGARHSETPDRVRLLLGIADDLSKHLSTRYESM